MHATRRRTAAGLATVALTAVAFTSGPDVAQAHGCASGRAAAYACAAPGDLVEARLGDLHPTQPVVGYDEIYYKLGRYRLDKDEAAGGVNKRFDDWCEANGQGEAATVTTGARLDKPKSFTCAIPLGQESADSLAEMKTAVVGPGGKLYLTDGHHTLTAFYELPDGGANLKVRVRVTDNFSKLGKDAFWKRMAAEHKVWLKDENEHPVKPGQLPAHLGLAGFRDDPYRSLVYFTRDIGYSVPGEPAEFLEFYWGSWLRGKVAAPTKDTDLAGYLDLVKRASQAMTALADDDIVAGGKTAAELGKMAKWNDGKKETAGEFAKLGRPLTDAKPGKLAYALDYKASLKNHRARAAA